MARLLFRIGRYASAHAVRFILGWVAVLAVAAGSFLAFGGTLATSFDIPGTETSRVTQEIADEVGGSTGATGTVVFHSSDDAALTPEQQADISATLAEIGELDGVAAVVDPFATEAERAAQAEQLAAGQAQIAQLPADQQAAAGAPVLEAGQRLLDAAAELRTVSEDGTAALGTVIFEQTAFELPAEVKESVVEAAQDASIDGVEVDVSSAIATEVAGLLGPGEIIGVIVALIVLVVMFRALLPAFTPLASSIVGVGVGVAGAMAASDVVEMSNVTPVLGVMLGLAVGIDYSLFIMSRHRRQLLAGMDLRESIGLANGTAGNAVVFAGSTVIVALLALNVTGINFLGVMGSVGAVCVLVAVLVSVTLTPALLGLLGTRVLSRRARRTVGHTHHTDTTPTPMRTSRAVAGGLVGILALLVIAIPALDMRLGLPDGSTEPTDTTAYRAYETTAREFGAGADGPLVVSTRLAEPATEETLTLVQADLADELMAWDAVAAVAPAGVSPDLDFMIFQVIPTDGPSSESTEELVHDLRAASPLDDGTELGVAGAASGNIDVSDRLSDALPVYLAVVVGLSLIILVLVFRSLLVPLIATAGYVLSLVAAFGAIVAVYQWGWLSGVFGVETPGPVLSFAPIIIMGVLFGLAMDYQLFLVSGMREAYVHGTPARAAVVAGRRSGRAVVTAAAIIMVSVFGGFVFSHLAMVRPLGFGLAIGVLFDAFVVRMLIVPALMHLFGDRAWWLPRWLDRILPNVDVEGSALERSHPVPGETHAGGAAAGDGERAADTDGPVPAGHGRHTG
ncbi:MMPL family transporter [Litorihabitans aurantiacus]|uniref:Membrane protein n=1 Tax=Litorihabitans aurantiacus TaxID=1930061 RepID=A0AA37XGT2_9MICO|nr:MMPL family transporter [Litorihabitans aurantiacus]GMA32954.1 membrane protein [Litorihabitans aurantiacus]